MFMMPPLLSLPLSTATCCFWCNRSCVQPHHLPLSFISAAHCLMMTKRGPRLVWAHRRRWLLTCAWMGGGNLCKEGMGRRKRSEVNVVWVKIIQFQSLSSPINSNFQYQTYLPAHPTCRGERALEVDTHGSWCHVSMFSDDVMNEYILSIGQSIWRGGSPHRLNSVKE